MRSTLLLLAPSLCVALASAAEPDTSWRFDAEQLRPFWISTTMQGESVLFLKDNADDQPSASLLFAPTRVLAVCSSSGAVTYQEGTDYVWEPGSKQIVLPPGSRIVAKTRQDLRRPANSQRYALTHRDGNGEILFGASHEYHDMQTVVTYTHRPDAWAGPTPSFAGDQLPRAIENLTQKRPLAIALLGDSISTGCNASGWANVAPFQTAYQDLLVMNLEAQFGAKVTLKNLAVGGTDTAWGLTMIDQVIEARPDLVILAFGMNDSAGRPADEYQAKELL